MKVMIRYTINGKSVYTLQWCIVLNIRFTFLKFEKKNNNNNNLTIRTVTCNTTTLFPLINLCIMCFTICYFENVKLFHPLNSVD